MPSSRGQAAAHPPRQDQPTSKTHDKLRADAVVRFMLYGLSNGVAALVFGPCDSFDAPSKSSISRETVHFQSHTFPGVVYLYVDVEIQHRESLQHDLSVVLLLLFVVLLVVCNAFVGIWCSNNYYPLK